MNLEQLRDKLAELRDLPTETEWAEFKQNNSDPQMIGEYLSAISNAAALESQAFGYIVWGIEDGTHNIVGTTFKPRQQKGHGNEDLEPWLNKLLAPRINFRIFEFDSEDGLPMVMFEVQAANTAPVAFSGRRYVRVGSHKKPLAEHPEKERKLWEIVSGPAVDWSAGICEGATINNLDPNAIHRARSEYAERFEGDPKKAHLAKEVWEWDDVTFLNKIKVAIDGQLTRAALILLGKEESTHHVAPAQPRMTWILKDDENVEQDYRHYDPPFLLAVDELLDNIRNLTVRYLPDGTLFPINVSQYDPWVMRETLHNCIAHQDYSKAGRIIVIEQPDSLLFTNLGAFYPGSVEEVVVRDSPQEYSANPRLAQAMVNLNMIDTIGSGIKRTLRIQRDRNFPLPTYDLSDPERVKVRLIGQILDPNYTRMLMSQTGLDLLDVIALDKVQKAQPINDKEAKSLRGKRLIEGRRPNVHVSADVAAATDTMVDYLRRRGIDREYCQKMILDLLGKGPAKRNEIDRLLLDRLSDALDETQRKTFIMNLLQDMRKAELIDSEGRGAGSVWQLHSSGTKGEE
ncbi:RNA-binding domain-containing protein [Aporhodopirellula aestuarii]|uniref:DNA binding domain-containing protein n=1 Tax=Aporhodopirellula aestuarii TaxID=2950107 RepID=A0ABT0U3C3_9BACT|nr:RNA-binding domain-containing protein [Aporhodopirellula aestuarii]MCM2371080.1 putative DNA binding domain-containing protein [Aporhodopirellula aestuarii]